MAITDKEFAAANAGGRKMLRTREQIAQRPAPTQIQSESAGGAPAGHGADGTAGRAP